MTTAPARVGPRVIFAIGLWMFAAAPVALIWIDGTNPGAGANWANRGLDLIGTVLVGFAVAAAVLLLAYPPFLPGLRLWWVRQKAKMNVDQGPILGAQKRLEDLPTARDSLIVGRGMLDMGNLRGALHHLVKAVELDPQSVPARFELGRLLARVGQFQTATEQLAFVVEADPTHAFGQALLELGRSLEKLHRDDEAIDALERHERQHGPNRTAMLIRARALARRGDRDQALELLRTAAAPPDGPRLDPEQALSRARARVALWSGGRA